MPTLKVIISGGGTGGHIFPAIAIADEIKKRNPDADILFVGADGRMEMTKVPEAGYPIKGLWISGIQRKLTLDNLSFPFKLMSSLWNASKIIKEFKPDIAIGVGGYASGPLLKRANARNVKTVLQEQNSFPGITNKWLARGADKICVAYSNMERWFPKEKISITGNPVRALIANASVTKDQAIAHFGLNNSKKTVLAIGGSLGARTINHALRKHIEKITGDNIQVIWQCGKSFSSESERISQNHTSGLVVTPFIKEMDMAYAAADVIISRAGAMSISELCLVGKPTILIPSPNVSEDHQTKNARALSDVNSAILLKDIDAEENLYHVLNELINDTSKMEFMSQEIKKLAKPNATEDIVNQIEQLLK
jgi:UDP-N-acetylglucosamine--N-acetylmuramyl-(pentapeptide) pyrophosphoryl-undecaprenol N-acetylglucosamine transferase